MQFPKTFVEICTIIPPYFIQLIVLKTFHLFFYLLLQLRIESGPLLTVRQLISLLFCPLIYCFTNSRLNLVFLFSKFSLPPDQLAPLFVLLVVIFVLDDFKSLSLILVVYKHNFFIPLN